MAAARWHATSSTSDSRCWWSAELQGEKDRADEMVLGLLEKVEAMGEEAKEKDACCSQLVMRHHLQLAEKREEYERLVDELQGL